jgi:hypothetical protein
MSKLKDKLSANMRTVKAGQAPAAPEQVQAASEKPAAKPAAEKPAAAGKPAKEAAAGARTVPGDVPQSGTALFPARVWPD